jgi:hypothetical protein
VAESYQTLVPKHNRDFGVACCSGASVEDASGHVCDFLGETHTLLTIAEGR